MGVLCGVLKETKRTTAHFMPGASVFHSHARLVVMGGWPLIGQNFSTASELPNETLLASVYENWIVKVEVSADPCFQLPLVPTGSLFPEPSGGSVSRIVRT